MGELETGIAGPEALVGVFQDITDRHAMEESLRRIADHDALTGIANRAAFDRTLAARIATAHAARTPLALVLIDLDGFKQINDTLGHLAGDDVLRSVGRRLGEGWLNGSFAARLGGDEFALIVEDPRLAADPATLVARVEAALCVPVTVEGLTMAASATVGAALLPDDIEAVRDFVHLVDTRLYAAKRARVGERRRGDRREGAVRHAA
jgi:diguanylate cyclase (GGDEF)-like protein